MAHILRGASFESSSCCVKCMSSPPCDIMPAVAPGASPPPRAARPVRRRKSQGRRCPSERQSVHLRKAPSSARPELHTVSGLYMICVSVSEVRSLSRASMKNAGHRFLFAWPWPQNVSAKKKRIAFLTKVHAAALGKTKLCAEALLANSHTCTFSSSAMTRALAPWSATPIRMLEREELQQTYINALSASHGRREPARH